MEIFFNILCIVSLLISIFIILDSDAGSISDSEAFVIFLMFTLPAGYFGAYFLFPQYKEQLPRYVSKQDLVINEFDNYIEYRQKDGRVIYTIKEIKDFKTKESISGFAITEKTGWGVDKTDIKVVYYGESVQIK